MSKLSISRRIALRRRLAIAFVLTAGMAAGTLAIGAAVVVSGYRTHAFLDRAEIEARRALATVEDDPSAAPARVVGGPEVVVVRGAGVIATSPELDLAHVPSDLRGAVQGHAGRVASATAELHGRSFTVVGIATEKTPAAYFFFARDDLTHGIREFRLGLLIGWLVVVAAAAAVGAAFARRVLRPVAEAADAAHAVAVGLLDLPTLPTGGDEFSTWATSFDSLAAALHDKIAALAEARDRERRFNADIAHDLRTPLGSVLTAATLLEQRAGELPPSLQRSLELVVEGARRLRVIADDLLELHRLEAGAETADREDVDVAAVVRAAVRGNGWDERAAVSVWGDTIVSVDPHRVDRIVVNLLANAVKHGGGSAHVVVAGRDDDVEVIVSDDGPGIAAHDVPRLFDRYVKVSAGGGASAGGSGLGLAIAREQADLLGAALTVDSEPGFGARFTLRLPRLP